MQPSLQHFSSPGQEVSLKQFTVELKIQGPNNVVGGGQSPSFITILVISDCWRLLYRGAAERISEKRSSF